MPYTITALTLAQLLQSDDITIKRNAMSILKVCQKCDHKTEDGHCIYCFKPELLCFWCNKRKAIVKDWREIDGTTGSYPSCKPCMNLPTEEVLKMSDTALHPKTGCSHDWDNYGKCNTCKIWRHQANCDACGHTPALCICEPVEEDPNECEYSAGYRCGNCNSCIRASALGQQ